MIRAIRLLPLLLLVALVPAPVLAQNDDSGEILRLLERYEETVTSVQSIEERLDPIRQEALERSSDLQARVALLQEALEGRFRALDPEYDRRMERTETLHDEAVAARESGDHGKMQELEREAEELRHHFQGLQEQVLSDPELEGELEAYQAELVRGMVTLDPEAEALVEELDSLNARMEELRVELTDLLRGGTAGVDGR